MCMEYSTQAVNPPLKNHKVKKSNEPGMRHLFKCLVRLGQIDSRLLLLASVASQRLNIVAEDIIYLGCRTQIILAGSNLKVSSLQSSFHGIRKYSINCQNRETINSATQLRHL